MASKSGIGMSNKNEYVTCNDERPGKYSLGQTKESL